ncbi:WD40-repeat-containing domain protein [Scenedesmus sp. NREL 46B-D3]|nr:WD40-repeat-containing domain protein [Scenedesmus sp. NREL 46B-D3]
MQAKQQQGRRLVGFLTLCSSSSSNRQQQFVLQCQLRGHENWVRAVQFARVGEAAPGLPGGRRVSLLLASAAQDRCAIWAYISLSGSSSSQPDALRQLITRYAPRPHLSTPSSTYWVSLEALLVGHEDWLHSISWRPIPAAGDAGAGASAAAAAAAASRQELTLLSVSQDRSMMLWSYDEPTGLWVSEAAVGDAGASCLGFYGGAFGPEGDWLVAHGFTGALHLWKQQQQQDGETPGGGTAAAAGLGLGGSSSSSSRCSWVPQHALGGHYGAVVDLAWGGDGGCLQSVSTDQTARLFTGIAGHWFEMARTQVGGGFVIVIIRGLSPSLLCVSGSEEKVLRVFEAPQAFVNTLTAIRAGGSRAAFGASVSALGLSNKALYAEDQADSGFAEGAYNEGPDFVPCAAPGVVTGPPLEEHLSQNTLWPEVRKLYGHGNDVFCVCSAPNGCIIASACKAQSAGAAAVWVWEVGSWKPLAQLPGHTLTVTQLEFSPNGRLLLSGSRDRSFSVAEGGFELLLRLKSAHSRIIWGVSWSYDSRLFATGSRDQTVKLWAVDSQGTPQQKPVSCLPAFSVGVTAVALAPQHVYAASLHLLAVGLDNGQVQVWLVVAPAQQQQDREGKVQQLWASQAWEQHAAAVRRLRWAPAGVDWLCGRSIADGAGDPCVQLASCGDDHSVRVYGVTL